MLTAEQIKKVSFRKASIGGYRTDEVDDFLNEAAKTFEALKKENDALAERVAEIQKKVDKLVEDKESINQTMITSEKFANRIKSEAKEEAARILKEARAQADSVIEDANERIIKEKQMIDKIIQESAGIRERLVRLFEQQIEALKKLPDQEDADKLKKELDKRYPTETYSHAEEAAPIDDDTFSTIEEAVKDATALSEETAANAAEEAADGTIEIEKSVFEKKFGKLKFGDNYDIKTES